MDFGAADPRFDNPRAVQIRLPPFTRERLLEVGRKIRDVYPAQHPERMVKRVDDDVLTALADGIAGHLGAKVGVPARVFLRKLVSDVLDRVDLFDDFDPKRDYKTVVDASDLTPEERAAAGIERSVDDIELDLGD